jgi:hypothetical protein
MKGYKGGSLNHMTKVLKNQIIEGKKNTPTTSPPFHSWLAKTYYHSCQILFFIFASQ